MTNKNTIELFSGTESFSNVAKQKGYKTFTIDNDKSFNPNLCIDISNMTIFDIPKEYFNPFILWASPPCQCFSVATIGRNWDKETRLPKNKRTEEALELIWDNIRWIKLLIPKFWFIENPRGMLRKVIPQIFEMHNIKYYRYTVSYCQYGDTRMKPTDIFTNIPNFKPKLCKNGASCHFSAPRGSKTGTQGLKNNIERGKIPHKLIEELIECCELLR